MKQVLVVEDQENIRELIRMTLEFEELEIHEAANCSTGLSEAIRLRPELVLLDVMMPGGMDGYAVCERIRATPQLKKTKVVMLTARAQPEDRARGLRAGANEYLVKPFSPQELLRVVNRLT
ncbi:MAG: response regulator transcription factor [Rubrivivax sp.]|jgi:DNA-binding response OmpR family regulator|nr:response regulator [Rubrivivax sp.]